MVVCVVFHPGHSLCESPNLFFHHGNFFVSEPLIQDFILFLEALHSDCVSWLKLILCLVTYQNLKLKCECRQVISVMRKIVFSESEQKKHKLK